MGRPRKTRRARRRRHSQSSKAIARTSANVAAGLKAAAALADVLDARVAILSAIEPPEIPTPEGIDALRDLQREAVAALPHRLRRRCAPWGRVTFGERVAQILKEAERHDLIVVVSHVRRPLVERALGTTAERLARSSPVPVLILPPEPAAAPAGRVEAPMSLP